MIAVARDTQERPAARQYGYEFGCEGVVRIDEARALLGGVGRTTVWRLWKSGVIRKGRVLGRMTYCRRSILDYLKSSEA